MSMIHEQCHPSDFMGGRCAHVPLIPNKCEILLFWSVTVLLILRSFGLPRLKSYLLEWYCSISISSLLAWAIIFEFDLGVVDGALEYLALKLSIVRNTILQGWIVSALPAVAIVCLFTGGTLADKFGRTRAYQLDAISLDFGAFLCATTQRVHTL